MYSRKCHNNVLPYVSINYLTLLRIIAKGIENESEKRKEKKKTYSTPNHHHLLLLRRLFLHLHHRYLQSRQIQADHYHFAPCS